MCWEPSGSHKQLRRESCFRNDNSLWSITNFSETTSLLGEREYGHMDAPVYVAAESEFKKGCINIIRKLV